MFEKRLTSCIVFDRLTARTSVCYRRENDGYSRENVDTKET